MPLKLKVKQKFQKLYKTVEIKPNYKIVLPSLVPFPTTIYDHKKNILADTTFSDVPISVSLYTMGRSGVPKCSAVSGENDITHLKSVQEFGCTLNLDQSKQCGIRC